MKTIRISAIAIAAAALLAVSGCVTTKISPEVDNLPRPIKVSLEISLLPGVTLPEEDLVIFNNLLRKFMREQGGECYTYTDQKETADVLVRVIGTDSYWTVFFGKILEYTLRGELSHEKKELFKRADAWTRPTWPRFVEPIAPLIKRILCGNEKGIRG